jgi:hypothetical protein
LTLTCGQNLTQNRLGNLGLIDARARNYGLDHGGTKFMGRRRGECAIKAADGGTCG